MDTGHQALILFYAFFWAIALSTTGRYQAFDTPSWFSQDISTRKRAIKRFFVAIFILNILPIILLLILYRCIPDGTDWTIIVAAVSASLSVFGFHRILHAFIASDNVYHHFYTKKEIDIIRSNSGFEQPQTMIAHLVPGIGYLLIFNLLAWFLIAKS